MYGLDYQEIWHGCQVLPENNARVILDCCVTIQVLISLAAQWPVPNQLLYGSSTNMVENLFLHFSGVAAVNFEQELNVITWLTTKWVDNFGDNSIVKGAKFALFHILAIFSQTVSFLFSTDLALASRTTHLFDRSCRFMYARQVSVSSSLWIRQRIGSLPYQLLPSLLAQSFCSLPQFPVILESRQKERRYLNRPKLGTSQATTDTSESSTGWARDYPSLTAYFPSLR
jgi:hypothetical protein